MWDKLEILLKDVVRTPPTTLKSFPPERLNEPPFHLNVIVQAYPKPIYFEDPIDVRSPVGCFLQFDPQYYQGLKAHVDAYSQFVNLARAREVITNYSIMGFADDQGHPFTPRRFLELVGSGNVTGRGGGVSTEAEEEFARQRIQIKNGFWCHDRTKIFFPIIDDNKGPDAPILALGNNLHRVLTVSPQTDAWYEDFPPPAAPRFRGAEAAYTRNLRSYLKKMAIQLIERDGWILFWRSHCYTGFRDFSPAEIFKSPEVAALTRLYDQYNPFIGIVDANNANQLLSVIRWSDFRGLRSFREEGRGFANTARAGNTFLGYFRAVGDDLRKKFQGYSFREDIELTGDLLHALVEGRLDESLTYNQMLTATAQYWQTRLKTVRNVHTQPPGLVMLKDGTVDLSFNFVSRPSTEGRPHVGYVKFVPERGQPKLIDKLKDFLGRIGQQVKKFIGKKVPPQALKGSDLRKMLVEVSCDCKDFKYRMSYANVKAGVTTQAGRTDNGRPPVITNPARRPGFCKHILATLRYLTDDAEIQISKDLSREQQEALKKDRAQFYKEARVAYQKMKAPAAKGAEEIKPEEEPPPSPEFAKLPAPPKPELAPRPPLPVTPAAPPPPNYPSAQ